VFGLPDFRQTLVAVTARGAHGAGLVRVALVVHVAALAVDVQLLLFIFDFLAADAAEAVSLASQEVRFAAVDALVVVEFEELPVVTLDGPAVSLEEGLEVDRDQLHVLLDLECHKHVAGFVFEVDFDGHDLEAAVRVFHVLLAEGMAEVDALLKRGHFAHLVLDDDQTPVHQEHPGLGALGDFEPLRAAVARQEQRVLTVLFRRLSHLARCHHQADCSFVLDQRVQIQDEAAARADAAVVQHHHARDGLEACAPRVRNHGVEFDVFVRVVLELVFLFVFVLLACLVFEVVFCVGAAVFEVGGDVGYNNVFEVGDCRLLEHVVEDLHEVPAGDV